MGAPKSKLKKRPLLGEVLVELGLLKQAEIDKAIPEAEGRGMLMGEHLVNEGLLTETDLYKALANQYGLEYCDLRTVSPSEKALQHIPHPLAVQLNALPLSVKGKTLTIAISDPSNIVQQSRLQKLVKVPFIAVVSPKKDITRVIENAYLKLKVHESKSAKSSSQVKRSLKSASGVKDSAGEIEQLINRILEQAIGHQASDIHLEPQEDEVQVRERIDGILESRMELPLHLHAALVSRLKILGHLDIAEKRNPQDGRFVHDIGDHQVDFRISTLPTIRGEKVVLRILDKSNMKIDLGSLGLSGQLVGKVKHLLTHPHGIILVSGPTGSGKTTTVYSMLNHINSIEKNIITIEDPVEYKFDIINQVQVNNRAGLGFATALRNILRQDPDIIMVGEIRDKETAEIAIRAALTGHLVISTIHTNDSVSAVSRLVEMGIDPFLISSSLLGVVAQRLVRKLCKSCQQVSTEATDHDSQLAINILAETGKLIRPKGCAECYNSGYRGREGIYEVLVIDKDTRKAIHDGASTDDILAMIENKGFETLRSDGVKKVKAGITTVEEVLRGTIDLGE